MLLINFKTYPQAIGPNALKLTHKLLEETRDFPQVEVGFAPPSLELAEVAAHTQTNIWAQHTDPTGEGQSTGFLSPSDAKAAGAVGTFLNHSEHPLSRETIAQTLQIAHEAGLKVLIFAKDPGEVADFATFKPDFIAYEPPELIGGDVSVSTAKVQVIIDAANAAKGIPLLVGAGIHARHDIEVALDLGAVGAVVSSAVVTAENPAEVFRNLLSEF